ncbi:MAG: alpha/beta fold hydrolase, partial [Myxococcota bacterium]
MAIVLLHGFTGSPVSFRPVQARLAHPSTAPTLPGHDGTPPPTDLDDALEAIRDQAGPKPFHLAGYSLGGRLALHYGLRYPEDVSALTIFGARPGIRTAGERLERLESDRQLASVLRHQGLEAFLGVWEALPLLQPKTLDRQAVAESKAIRRRHDASGLAGALETLSVAALPDLWPHLRDLPCNPLWVFGEADAVYRPLMRQASEIIG